MNRILPRWLADLLVTLAVGAAAAGDAYRHETAGLTVPVALSGAAILLLRRRYPVGVLVAETALASLLAAVGVFWLVPAVLVAVSTTAAAVRRERSLQLTVLSMVVLGPFALMGSHSNVARLLPVTVLFAIAWSRATAARRPSVNARTAHGGQCSPSARGSPGSCTTSSRTTSA